MAVYWGWCEEVKKRHEVDVDTSDNEQAAFSSVVDKWNWHCPLATDKLFIIIHIRVAATKKSLVTNLREKEEEFFVIFDLSKLHKISKYLRKIFVKF